MAVYAYRCSTHGDYDQSYDIGTNPRTTVCPSCGRRGLQVIGQGVQIAPSALQNKGANVRAKEAEEKGWDVDMPAYYRMRQQGLQPEGIDGSAAKEDRAGDQFDIDYKPLLDAGVSKSHLIEKLDETAQVRAEMDAPSETLSGDRVRDWVKP